MKKSYTDENTGISYTLVGEIYLPNLLLPDTNYSIGLWGERHRQYIRQYRRPFYASLVMQCKLNAYLHEVDERASEMYHRLVDQLAEQQGITEKMKKKDMFKWARAINNIANQAREIVMHEVICPEESI